MPDPAPDISNRFKLAAIDLDGTLLGPDHAISDTNAAAIRRLQAAGAQVILASGRHYNSMHKYVAALPGVQWVVSCQGGELSNAGRTTVLSRKFLSAVDTRKTLAAGRALGFTTVAYAVEDIFTDAQWDAELDFYTDLAGQKPVSLPLAELLARAMFKVIWMGKPEAIARLSLAPVAGTQVQAVRTNAKFLEFMPADVTKGAALNILAAHLGIAPSETVVFGDGENDIPMFEWAGTSVAMAHGWPLALKKAKFVTPAGPPETAFARGVDLILKSTPASDACERCGSFDASEIGGQMLCTDCVTQAGCGCAGHVENPEA